MNAPATALRGMKGFVLLGEATLLVWLMVTEGLSGIGLVAACVLGAVAVALAVLAKWPLGAVLTLIIASAIPRLTGSLSGLHVRPEHVATAFILLILVLKVALGGGGRLWPRLQSFDYFLIGYVLLNFFTSAFTSPQPSMTLRWATLNAIIIVPFFLVRSLLVRIDDAVKSVQLLLWVSFAESLFGIACYLSNALFHTTLGISTGQYGSQPGLFGTQFEPNIFGSYTGCCAILFLAFFLMSEPGRRAKYGWGAALSLIAALMSLARSVMLALPVAAAFVIWAVYKSDRIQVRTVVRLALAGALLLAALSPFLASAIKGRFVTLNVDDLSSDSSALTRLVSTAAGIEDVRAHPLLGTGTASFQLLFDWDDYIPGISKDIDQGGWLGNSPLRILHDTGIVGLIVFLLFVTSLALATRKAYKTATQLVRSSLLALLAGLILYAITFQATEATMLAFTWVHFGLLAALVSNERTRVTALHNS